MCDLPRTNHLSSEIGGVMRSYERFIYAPISGAPGNEYRMVGNWVQFRVLTPGDGSRSKGPWQTLDRNDLLIHFGMRTAVAKWLIAHRRIVEQRAGDAKNAGERTKSAHGDD